MYPQIWDMFPFELCAMDGWTCFNDGRWQTEQKIKLLLRTTEFKAKKGSKICFRRDKKVQW